MVAVAEVVAKAVVTDVVIETVTKAEVTTEVVTGVMTRAAVVTVTEARPAQSRAAYRAAIGAYSRPGSLRHGLRQGRAAEVVRSLLQRREGEGEG